MSNGFRDKTYWRFTSPSLAHCFKKTGSRNLYVALCGVAMIQGSGGQANARPRSELRCPRCDGMEATRRGWEECGPTLAVPADYHYAEALPPAPLVAVTFSGTYLHATLDGRKTLCGRDVVRSARSAPDSVADPSDELLCGICRKAVKAC